MRVTPSMIVALGALFFALGGSAVAVTQAVKPQARCQPGAVRGYVAVTGEPTKGIANIPDTFTSAKGLFAARFTCQGGAPQVRRVDRGVYEVRFPGNAARVAAISAPEAQPTGGYNGTAFRVNLWVPGRFDPVDTPFVVIAM
ncbi:MAG: hypothetical protein OEW65_02685 [Thermoleophilia bacterium]|nr:hypothetical protein [Thermoleophilia bacterium]